ncbi:MAG: flagellar basal body L-ring protein [Verrucomicrobiaceae bacterium]|nr:flagellar basal body L-ring protein [Verrucomicrobiaceae bacterium]
MIKQRMIHHLALIASIASALTACTIGPEPKPGDPAYAPVSAPAMMPPPPNQGGIYQAGGGLSLFEDKRARRIGDVITISLAESTTSSKKADSAIKKDDKVNLDAGVVLGAQPKIGGVNMTTAINPTRDFSGAATADQSNKLQGTITVMVSDVLPNGLLEVRGEKWMTLNRGEEFIRIRGYVRPEDVLPDNTIASTKVADVRITYSGSGELAQSNRQGWASRFFGSEWWPF